MPTIITRGAGSARGFGFGGAKFVAAPSQQAYTTPGTYSWVAPAGVTSVSVVAVGGGSGRGNYVCCVGYPGGWGGGLGYKNNFATTPGASYTVVVGVGGVGCGAAGGDSYFNSLVTVKGGGASSGSRGTYTGNGGGNGGCGGPYGACNSTGGGGGAGGYSGNGGSGGSALGNAGSAGSGGGGGGGGSVSNGYSGGGGGVGILGAGSNGTAGSNTGGGGGGGSGGTAGNAYNNAAGADGGLYGGGAGGGTNGSSDGGKGAVRIIWPGTTRTFPSTCTGDK